MVLACAAFALVTTALVGVWTAPVATRMSGGSALGAFSGTATGVGRRSTSALLAAQVALGFVLLTAGALTVASLAAAWREDTGYRRERMILVEAYIREVTNGCRSHDATHTAR